MESLDEFQMLESMIQKSEESLKRNQKSTSMVESNDNNDDSKQQMDLLENIISNELSNHDELYDRNELIKKLCKRLHQALQNNEEIRKSEMVINQELQDMKHEMQQFTTMMMISSTKSQRPSTNSNTSLDANNDESSLELCRKQILNQSSFLSQMDYNHIDLTNANNDKIDCNDQPQPEQQQPNVQMLIEQIRMLEKKIEIERHSYLEENERLNLVIDEKQKFIDDLLLNNDEDNGKTLMTTTKKKKSICDNSSSEAGYNQQTNNRLLVVLSDLVKTFLDTEQDIQKQLETLGLESVKNGQFNSSSSMIMKNGHCDDSFGGFPSLDHDQSERLLMSTTNSEIVTFDLLCEDGPDLTTPSDLIYNSNNPLSYSTNTTITGSGSKSLMNGQSNDIEDDVVLGASRRLRLAVERVLKILSNTMDQQKQDYNELQQQKNELQIEFQEECKRSDQLTRQLMEKEQTVKILENEKKLLNDQLIDYNEIRLQQQCLREKLDEFEHERDRFINDNKRFEMERKSFDKGLPQLHQNKELLNENETLSRDIRDLQQEKKNLLSRINHLTGDLESIRSEKEMIVENKNIEFEELQSQLDAKEKNLCSLKRFIDEQTQEREMERDEFNKELVTLKDKLKEREKLENKLRSQLRTAENQLTIMNDDCKQRDEQIDELNRMIKDLNQKLSESNSSKQHLEMEIERNNQCEKNLRSRLKKLSTILQIRLNDEADWNEVLTALDQFIMTKSSVSSPVKVFGLRKPKINTTDTNDLDNSIFTTIKLMDDRIVDLNTNIESLQLTNDQMKNDLQTKIELIKGLEQLKPKIEYLEKNIQELNKTNDLLQQEINTSHIKCSQLKVKLDSSVDIQEFRKVVQELQTKLIEEKQQTESITVKLEQSNRHVNELTEKLDAYKKEIRSFKELLKSHDHCNGNNVNVDNKKTTFDHHQRNSKDLTFEMAKLNDQLEIKDKTILMLENNIEIFKTKFETMQQERDCYHDRLKCLDDSRNKITIYEKNIEKLRLQNKISMDKITYLELEIQNLRKKIELLEKENCELKIDNQKLLRQKQDMLTAAADYVDLVAEQDLAISTTNTVTINNNNNQQMNGLDRINSISSNNLLMLKVRRLLTQKGALIYQKNYLIHVLNSYQRTENDTLALLANFNNSKESDEDDNRMHGKSRFRSIVYALIALSRMRFMVNIWQCRKRQFLFHKTANSIAALQNVPLPPRQTTKDGKSLNSSSSSASSSVNTSPSRLHLINIKQGNHHPVINSTLKDYVDRLHVVHETLGLYTNKRL
uniref:A-kinase anchor protein 9-like isoform X3 n=1 Tax=Dermatophagoides pteronyssinus TaxID=6956 RepID=A0A6P6Y681_DERPT|nr:A-kinase anchor protein 9-like isoform X3 [Dermatophagoides pteronyssinus]